MRVALVGAEFEDNLAIRYLWSALEARGHQVVQVVFNAPEELERAARELCASGAAVAGFSMVFTLRAREFAALATRARELGFPGHIIAGGHFAAFHAERILTDVPALDSIGTGEGEELLPLLCERLGDLGAVPGLVWRRGADLVRNPAAVKPPDLDVLPAPPRKQPFDSYLGLPITNLLGSRGCMHGCAFCSIVAWHKVTGGPRLRLRAPEQIADEMADLYRRGVRIFNFHDDNFFLDDVAETRARVEALERAWQRRGLGRIAFAVKSRPDTVDEELFAYLKSLGMFRLFLGIEAGTAEALARLGRGQSLDDNRRALAVVNRLDIHTCFNLLLWNPDSTLEDLVANVAFLRAHPDNPMNFCRTEVYTGTPLEKKLRRAGRLRGDYWGWDYDMADPRAEASFQLAFPAFRARNYGDEQHDGIHHLVMQVDYEHQLLGHFFQHVPALRERVKAYIVDVNLNSCSHLEEALDAAALGLSEAQRAQLAAGLRRRVVADDARFLARGRALLDEIRLLARERPRAVARPRRATAVASIAVSLALAGCTRTPRSGSHMTETVAAPPPDAAPPPEAPLGDSALLRDRFWVEAKPLLLEHVRPPADVELTVWLGPIGQVEKTVLHAPVLPEAAARALSAGLERLVFPDPALGGKRYRLSYPAWMLEPPTQMSEMAPRPTRPPTHRSEMAPMPSRKPGP